MPRSQTQQRNPKDRSAQKPAQKRKNGRSLNALSIAEKQIPTRLGVRRSRLGAYDDGSSRKRNTGGDDEDEEEETPHYKRRRTEDTGSLDGGSDSEGHEWTLGQVNSDDDSELDSDEALGESDEERFEGFTFRASKSKNQPKKAAPKPKKPIEINLDEDDESEEESDDEDQDEEDDELGEDAVDLATAWDMNTAADEEDAREASKKAKRAARDDDDDSEEDSGSEADSESDASEDGLSASDDDDDADPHGLSKLQDFVQSMETGKPTKRTQKSQEQGKPSEYGLTSSNKLTVADLLPSITDSRLKNSLKHIDSVVQSSKSGIPGKLDAPLAKRQQDRIDRTAAYEKSKETLNRWLDTVKANRRAEHISFPLRDPDAEQSHRLEVSKPQTDLESAIQNILVESGLAEAEGKTAEDQIQSFEELQARNIPVEEIQARRAELRKRRDLLFREEVRAKRIKKIKSKSYRRVHRKERERLEQQERQALMEAGVDPDEMDQEKSERQRAEARMGSKHRESKWAKGLKQTGRTAWDEDARNSAADLAQREEELRKRIEGKRVSTGDDDYLGSSSSESEEEEDPWNEEGSDVERQKIQKKLSALEGKDNSGAVKGPHADLFEMKFMKNADAARKEQNDAELRQLNRELHGEGSESEADSEVGRRKFGQSKKDDSKSRPKPLPKNEFEEKLDSDDEDAQAAGSDNDMDIVVDQPAKQQSGARGNKNVSQSSRKSSNENEAQEEAPEEENPWLVQTERTNRRRTGPDAQESIDISLDAAQPEVALAKTQSKKQKNAQAALAKKQFDEENDSEDEDNVPVLLKNHDLVKRAFAGDEVVQDFDQDKMDTIEDEGDKVVDNTLQGWGSWAGEGVSKRQQKKQKRDLTTIAGVQPQQRKDAKLDRVIINQKRIQKNKKYMAGQLPHQFENKTQYERSLRMPLGPEWSTKETFQSGTKPRVMIKQGIIKPMEKPML